MMAKVIKLFYMVFISILICACQPKTIKENKEKKMSTNEIYQLGFGTQGEQQFIKYAKDGEDRQPAGMGFYELLWEAPNLATVNISLGTHHLFIPNAISVLGTKINYDKSMQGIQIIDLNAGLNKQEYVTEEQAYQAYKDLFTEINLKGWVQYFDSSSARLNKKDNIKSVLSDGLIIDPQYIFTFDEWKNIMRKDSSVHCFLYLDGVVLTLSLRKTDIINNHVQYIIRYSFESINYIHRNLIENSYKMNRAEFKRAYQESIKNNEITRRRIELASKAKGYHIDESYIDPEVWQFVESSK